ncbi:N/A [soil metagenome]
MAESDRPDNVPPEGGPTLKSEGRPIFRHRLTRAGIFAWSILGLFATLVVFIYLLDMFKLVVIPLVIALFPAALLSPISGRLKRWGFPPLAAAALVVVVFLVGFFGLFVALVWLIAGEFDNLIETLEIAYEDLSEWINDTIGWAPPSIDELIEQVQNWATDLEVGQTATTVAFVTFEVIAGILLGAIALLFYLKDGDRMAGVALQVTPERLRDDVAEIFRRVWNTIGGYFRGQLVVALVDAIAIGIGLFLLGVPLALPLAMLVFFGGLFPIVGAFTAGAVAVLVALADGGLGLAIAVLILNVAVQQLEGNLLEPLIVGRATQLHPLLILASLTAGAVTLGILGAFLAVPITAAIVRAVTYVLERDPELAVEYDAELPELDDYTANSNDSND